MSKSKSPPFRTPAPLPAGKYLRLLGKPLLLGLPWAVLLAL